MTERPDESRAWYVVSAKTGREQEAVERLLQQGYGAWCPLCIRVRNRQMRWKGGPVLKVTAIEPLFPPYLFAGVAPGQGASPIRNTIGVYDFLRSDRGMAVRIANADLLALWDRVQADGGKINLEPPDTAAFERGSMVRVTEGPFSSFSGICSWSTKDRTKILLDIFGRKTETLLPTNQVEKVTG